MNKCPLCNNSIKSSEQFCHRCKELQTKYNPENLLKRCVIKQSDKNNQEYLSIKESSSKTKTQSKIIKSILLVVCIFTIGSYWYYDNRLTSDENTEWQKAIKQNSSTAFSEFLDTYPQGIYSKDAEKKIEELQIKERSMGMR